MSEQTLNLVQLIRERLQATVRRVLKAEAAYGLALTLGILAALWLVSAGIEAGFWLGTASRSALSWAMLAVVAGLIVYFLALPLLRLFGVLPSPSEEAIAARIGERYPDVSDRLTNLLHLSQGKRSESPDAFVDRAVRMLGEQIRPVPFEQVEDFGQARRFSRYAGVPLAGLVLFLLLAPTAFIGASQRLLSPGIYFQRPAPFQLSVEPGSRDLVKGEPLNVTVRATGRVPQSITLELNNEDEEHVDEIQLSPDSTGIFRHTVVNVREPLRYRITVDPVETPWYEVAVVERPLLRRLNVSLDFPRYARIPSQQLQANVGDVEALAGTQVSVAAAVGGPHVKEAYLQFDDGTRDTLRIDGETARGSFTLRNDGQYRIILRNEHGVENENPIAYSLKALRDAPPAIALLEPDSEGVLTDALEAALRARITDDYGFSRLQLSYRLAESRFGTPTETFEAIRLPLQDPSQIDQDVVYDWLLSETTRLDPVPGDVIEYFVQVWDNDTFSGPKTARTEMHRLRLPSLSEQYEEVDRQQDQAQDELSGIMEEAEKVGDQFKELQDNLRSKQESDWQDQRQLQRLQDQQKSLEDRVESLSEQVESLTSQMQENNLVSEETLQQYRELQKVIDEINSPELQDALRQLQQAMQQLDLQQLQQSLGKFQVNEQQYKERLERTLELFKKLRMQQQLDEAAKRAQALAELQKELAQETGKLMQEQKQPDAARQNDQSPRDSSESGKQQTDQPQNPEQQDPSEKTGQRQDSTQGNRQDQADPDKQSQEKESQDQESPNGEDQGRQKRQAEEQSSQSKQGEQQQSKDRLAAEQERSRDEMRDLEQKLQEMQQKMDELRSAPKEQMEKLGEQARQQQLSNEMQQNAQQLQQSQLPQAQQGQQQMNQKLQQMSQQLQQMQQSMQSRQMQVNMAGLRRALEDVLTLSKRQEDLQDGVRGLSSDNARLRDYARRQEGLSESLRAVSDSLQKLAHNIPQMDTEIPRRTGDALNAMRASVEAMTERSATEASGFQQASMTHLNDLALLLSDLMNQLNNAQNGGSGGMSMQQMLQQLQQMAGQQQQLNDQVQQMLNDMHGDRLSPDMQQRLGQMAQQQSAIRRQLQQLNRDPNARGKMLGDLNRVAEQMEETIRDLQQQQVSRPLVERQQQILTRLLDAQKSLQQRGQEKERQSRTGQDVERASPPDLPPAEQIDQLRRDLLRALDSGYAPDYEELIKRYFELLQEQQGQAAKE